MTQEQTAPGPAIEDTPFKPVAMLSPAGMPPEHYLGARVSKARAHYKLTVEALSRLCKAADIGEGRGISPPSIARYEANTSLPGTRELRLLAQALGVSTDWLVYGHIDAAGKSDVEQQLIDLLRRFVAEQQADHFIVGNTRTSEMLAFLTQQDRAAALQEARKPI